MLTFRCLTLQNKKKSLKRWILRNLQDACFAFYILLNGNDFQLPGWMQSFAFLILLDETYFWFPRNSKPRVFISSRSIQSFAFILWMEPIFGYRKIQTRELSYHRDRWEMWICGASRFWYYWMELIFGFRKIQNRELSSHRDRYKVSRLYYWMERIFRLKPRIFISSGSMQSFAFLILFNGTYFWLPINSKSRVLISSRYKVQF